MGTSVILNLDISILHVILGPKPRQEQSYLKRLFLAGLRTEDNVGTELQELLVTAKKITPSKEQNEEQRRSFAFGNTNIENPIITRETVDNEAENLKRS